MTSRKTESDTKKVLSIADARFEGLTPLPGTAVEARIVREAFGSGSWTVETLSGREATERNLRRQLAGSRYVHLATHGFVDTSQGGLFATLALTPPSQRSSMADDGRLQLFEIYELDLDAELAVLSACTTRVGTVVSGDGIFALSRGFQAAGARRVVASLWETDDTSSATLIGQLFRAIAEAHAAGLRPNFARALADAKRAVRQDPAHAAPFFWSPFVLDGPG